METELNREIEWFGGERELYIAIERGKGTVYCN